MPLAQNHLKVLELSLAPDGYRNGALWFEAYEQTGCHFRETSYWFAIYFGNYISWCQAGAGSRTLCTDSSNEGELYT